MTSERVRKVTQGLLVSCLSLQVCMDLLQTRALAHEYFEYVRGREGWRNAILSTRRKKKKKCGIENSEKPCWGLFVLMPGNCELKCVGAKTASHTLTCAWTGTEICVDPLSHCFIWLLSDQVICSPQQADDLSYYVCYLWETESGRVSYTEGMSPCWTLQLSSVTCVYDSPHVRISYVS